MQHLRLAIILTFGWMPLFSRDTIQSAPAHFGYLQVFYHAGTTWSRTVYLSEQFSSGFRSLELRAGFQSTGKKMWELFHHYPRYGLGIHYGDLVVDPKDTIVGNPFSSFAFFSAPWARFGRVTLYSETSLGLSYTSLFHDPVTNPYNDVIASRINLYFNFNLNFSVILNKRVELQSGVGLTHYSNGSIQKPQKGINNWGFNLGMSYHFRYPRRGSRRSDGSGDVRPDLIYFEIPDTLPRNELQIMASAGIVEKQRLGEKKGTYFYTSSFTVDYAVPLTLKNRITFGFDFLYDGSLERSIPGTPPEEVTMFQKTYLGSHMGYQVLIDRITLFFNFGTYFLQHSLENGIWFMRAGGRVRVSDHLHTHIAIKTKAGIRADWIEWGMAYYIQTR